MDRVLLLPALLAFTGAACMHGAPSQPSPAAAANASAAPAGATEPCPMDVPGTKVAVADTATGEAVTFTTAPDHAAALQERVHAMAERHERMHGAGGGMGGMHGGAGMGGTGMGGMEMPPPSHAVVEDLPDGARLTITPTDPADLQRLQATVRRHAGYMQQHGCGAPGAPGAPMMGRHHHPGA